MRQRIASIHFSALHADRNAYGGHYDIPAVAKDAEPFVLNIEDKIQSWRRPFFFKRELAKDNIGGMEIALCLMREWTASTPGMTPQCHPGIWIVRDRIAIIDENLIDGNVVTKPRVDAEGKQITREATPEECKQMWEEDLEAARLMDLEWAAYRVAQADEWYESPQQRKFIGPDHRRAAVQYGYQREWLKAARDKDVKYCPVCRQTMPVDAMKCKCGEIVDHAAYRRFKELGKAQEEAVKLEIKGPPQPKHECACGEKFLAMQDFVKHRVECKATTRQPVPA